MEPQSVVFSNNDFFGAKELFTNIDRCTSTVSLTDSQLIDLTKEEIRFLVEHDENIALNVHKGNNDFHFDKERNNIIHENISGLQMIMPSHDNTLDDFSSEKDISDTINSIKEQKMSVLIVFKNLTNIDLTTLNI